ELQPPRCELRLPQHPLSASERLRCPRATPSLPSSPAPSQRGRLAEEPRRAEPLPRARSWSLETQRDIAAPAPSTFALSANRTWVACIACAEEACRTGGVSRSNLCPVRWRRFGPRAWSPTPFGGAADTDTTPFGIAAAGGAADTDTTPFGIAAAGIAALTRHNNTNNNNSNNNTNNSNNKTNNNNSSSSNSNAVAATIAATAAALARAEQRRARADQIVMAVEASARAVRASWHANASAARVAEAAAPARAAEAGAAEAAAEATAAAEAVADTISEATTEAPPEA
ncbi:unnamed protein product, partial [Polarella glacialis]